MFVFMPRKRSDAIRDFLEGNLHHADLSYQERDYLKQLQTVEAMWADGKTDVAVRNALSEQYHISDNTSRKIMRDCMLVFGDMKEVNRKMIRYRAGQMALKAYEMAEEEGNYKAMIAATKAFSEANGINNEDPDLPEFENMSGGAIITMLPEGMEDLIRALASAGGVIDQTVMPDLKPEKETIDITEYESEP
jgi:hypothetical protein